MPPSNLRAVVAQMYRGGSRQAARNFSSSPPGEGVIATGLKKSRDSSSVPEKKNPSVLSWVVAGFTLNFFSSWMTAMHRQRILEKRMEVIMSKSEQSQRKYDEYIEYFDRSEKIRDHWAAEDGLKPRAALLSDRN